MHQIEKLGQWKPDSTSLPLAYTDDGMQITFGDRFLFDHAGAIISDPRTALIELIANAYDAGATTVDISWPQSVDGLFSISDNGVGMTREEFVRRWCRLNYNRQEEQSSTVVFPSDVQDPPRRRAFGQNGKGRHACFCFSDTYTITTKKNKVAIVAEVMMSGEPNTPFDLKIRSESPDEGHGTRIDARLSRNLMPVSQLREAIGSKFLVDPRFQIRLNGTDVDLESLSARRTSILEIFEVGKVAIHSLDGQTADRTTQLRGITYWVNGRMVGEPSWDGLDASGAILDGRSAAAKRYSFVVEADILQHDVRADWKAFATTEKSRVALSHIRRAIEEELQYLLRDSIKDRKRAALTPSKTEIRAMSPVSKKALGEFVDAIQQRCPTVSEDVLAKTVEVFVKMETSRTGHYLLSQLAECSPDDIDRWSEIVNAWTAQDAKLVLDELGRRLSLISQLERLVNDGKADELHEIHPLFERGLWIFGPEYERVDFKSNRALSTVVREMLGGTSTAIDHPLRRPDIVALPDRTLSVYSADLWDRDGEACGIDRVLIIELKKGGFTLTGQELYQGKAYSDELRKGAHVNPGTRITVFVLGSKLGIDAQDEIMVGQNVWIKPMVYDHFIRRAHNRTFHLLEQISDATKDILKDPEIDEILGQGDLFQPAL